MRRKVTRTISLLMVFALLMGSICLGDVMQVNAGISSRKMTLISTLYNSLHMAGEATRLKVLTAITGGTDIFVMKNVTADSDAYAMADAINAEITTDIDRTTLKTLVQDFYKYQTTNAREAKFVLEEFKAGLDITVDTNDGTFPTITTKIETYTYEYLLFVNFIGKVKDIYSFWSKKAVNPIYVANGKIMVYDDLQDLSLIAKFFGEEERAESYRNRLNTMIGKLNEAAYDAERPALIANLKGYNLLDASKRNDNPPTDPGDPGTPGTGIVTAPPDTVPSIAPGAIVIQPTLNSGTGIASVTLTDKTVFDALANAKPNADGNKELLITANKTANATGYAINLPSSLLASPKGDVIVTIKTDSGTMTAPSNMFTDAGIGTSKNIEIYIGKADTKDLSEEQKKLIGDRPIVELKAMVDGKPFAWNNPEVFVQVAVKYTPTAEELKDKEHIVVWYLDGNGKAVQVTNGRYNELTGEVVFSTNHFSKFAIGYRTVSFKDLGKFPWAQKPISVMASKGIITGVTADTFDPAANITRGEYIHMLITTLNLSAKIDGNFVDVSADSPYYNTIGIAKKLGIATGIGKNKLNPNAAITRQDMMVLTVRALKTAKKLDASAPNGDLSKFKDNTKIAGYARDSVAQITKAGIINGDGINIMPLANTNRAEAAVIMYRIYNK